MNLADALLSQSHPAGSVIVRQGDSGDGMYFVEDGEVDVSMVGSGGDSVEKHVTSLRQVCSMRNSRGRKRLYLDLRGQEINDIDKMDNIDCSINVGRVFRRAGAHHAQAEGGHRQSERPRQSCM